MLSLKWLTRAKSPFLHPLAAVLINPAARTTTTGFLFSSAAPVVTPNSVNLQSKDVSASFKDWFRSGKNPLFDDIFRILAMYKDDSESKSVDSALGKLGLRLNERFVLDVLSYGKDVLTRLKFFDWAGRQPGFGHTRATFIAIFKILSREKLMSLILDFLDDFSRQRYISRTRFHDVLVMGYAVAGKPHVALQVFARMRFSGLDLNDLVYHVLLNSLVEEGLFDVAETILKQIRLRGFENEVTHSITVKSFCRQKRLEEAESYVQRLMRDGHYLNGYIVGTLVDAFFDNGKAEKALELVDEFRVIGKKRDLEVVYGISVRGLVRCGRLDDALEFLKTKNLSEGFVPDVFKCNQLIFKLLKENMLQDVYDLLMEMKEDGVLPDKVTMDAALCFLCKAGMVDAAVDLYNSRAEFGLEPSGMAYNYLVSTLCQEGRTDEAYNVMKSSVDQGYSSSKATFSILADALCRDGKLDKVKEVVFLALERNIVLRDSSYKNFISALCKARRVEDGYLILQDINKRVKNAPKQAFFRLIQGFNVIEKGDIAARLVMELQEKGHTPNQKLLQAVVYCICESHNPEQRFYQLLRMQLSRFGPSWDIFNCFIDGAGHALKPLLARSVYELMRKNGILPNLDSDILMLQSYLRSCRISDAIIFFNEVKSRQITQQKFHNAMVAGLCKAKKPAIAWDFVCKMRRDTKLVPSLECYELLLQSFCRDQDYIMAVKALNDMEGAGYRISTFSGNALIWHSCKGKELYDAWTSVRNSSDEMSGFLLGQLIGIFSECVRTDLSIEKIEDLLAKCFPLDIFTYNLILQRLSMTDIDAACKLFNRIRIRGYEPNRWTYDILVRGLFKHGRTAEAEKQVDEMFHQGFS
uniref:Pentatricopeptide repeat-containing protein n=1 Tax=Kalanchoe fedtschenkoi TaxID=63787 RepID=A0A7N0T8M1_KALFE